MSITVHLQLYNIIVTDTAQCMIAILVCFGHITVPLVQGEDDDQWVVGRAGAALEDKREYQLMLSEGRRRSSRVEGSSGQLHEVRPIVLSDIADSNSGYYTSHNNNYIQLVRAREVEQQLMAELQQLTREKEQASREKDQVCSSL